MGIYEVLRCYLVSVGVNLENLAGFAADICATMMGQLNGVQSILLKEHPHIIVVCCTQWRSQKIFMGGQSSKQNI